MSIPPNRMRRKPQNDEPDALERILLGINPSQGSGVPYGLPEDAFTTGPTGANTPIEDLLAALAAQQGPGPEVYPNPDYPAADEVGFDIGPAGDGPDFQDDAAENAALERALRADVGAPDPAAMFQAPVSLEGAPTGRREEPEDETGRTPRTPRTPRRPS